MKKDFQGSVIPETIAPSNQQVTTVEIPAALAFNVPPEMVVTLKLSLIKPIAKFSSPDVIYPLVKDLVEISPESLLSILKTETCLAESRFWSLATNVFNGMDQYVEQLQGEGKSFQEGDDACSFMARELNQDFARFNEYSKRISVERAGVLGDKSCHVFASPQPAQLAATSFRQINPNLLKEALVKCFEGRGYEDHCEIMPFDNDRVSGFQIHRGGRRAMTLVRDTEKQIKYRDDQKLKYDTIYFIKQSNSIWISCSAPNDAPMYAEVISSLMIGTPIVGKRKSFDLQALMRQDLGTLLTLASHQTGLSKVQVRYIYIKHSANGKLIFSAKRWDPCLTELPEVVSAIRPSYDLMAIKLRFVLDPGGKEYRDLDLSLSTINIDIGLEPLLVDAVLTHLGVCTPYAND